MNYLLMFFLLAMIIMGVLLLVFINSTEITITDKPKEILFFGYTDEEIKDAYRYHGIMSATFSNAEEPYFVRNGEKIKLFGYRRNR